MQIFKVTDVDEKSISMIFTAINESSAKEFIEESEMFDEYILDFIGTTLIFPKNFIVQTSNL